MSNKFEISDNGLIFYIDDDGTINRIGKIDSQGKIEGNTRSNGVAILWVFLIVAVITSIVLGVNLSSAKNDLYYEQNSTNNLESQVSDLKSKNDNLNGQISNLANQLSSLSNTFPFQIDKIEIGNTDYNRNIIDDYGSSLYASRMRYLMPKIYYTGFANGKSVTIYYKIFNPDGNLYYNSSYSSIYTYYTSVTIYQGSNNTALGGFGDSSTSFYPSGTYRIEVWCNEICLGTKSFYIY